jgi:hypothetical protein
MAGVLARQVEIRTLVNSLFTVRIEEAVGAGSGQ